MGRISNTPTETVSRLRGRGVKDANRTDRPVRSGQLHVVRNRNKRCVGVGERTSATLARQEGGGEER